MLEVHDFACHSNRFTWGLSFIKHVFNFSKALIVKHAVDRPGFSVLEFSLKNVQEVNEFILTSYVKDVESHRLLFQSSPIDWVGKPLEKNVSCKDGETLIISRVLDIEKAEYCGSDVIQKLRAMLKESELNLVVSADLFEAETTEENATLDVTYLCIPMEG